MTFRFLSFIPVVLLSVTLGIPQAAAQLTPAEAAAAMGRGTNLGNTLEPPVEGGWNNPAAREYYFDDFRARGFQTVRIPVRWDEHTAMVAPYAVDESWMNRVQQVVDWALERDLFVILNAHHEEWIKANYADATQRARFDAIWVQIADRFKDHPDKLVFEIINEPKGLTQGEIDDLNARVLGLIRQSNPTRIVVLGGHEWSGLAELLTMAVPNDPYIMGYYHSYDPWEFAGQAMGTWGTDADKAALKGRLATAKQWWVNTGVPVMVSEWGAVRTADFNSRMRYYSTYTEEAVAAGIPFMVWDDGGDFGIYQRADRQWPEVADVLINGYVDGPTSLKAEVRDQTYLAVSWTNRANFGGQIDVQRRTGSGSFQTIGSASATASEYLDADFEEDTVYDYRVIARNTGGPDRVSHAVRVRAPALTRFPYQGVPLAVPGTVQAEDFDEGGEGLTYHESDNVNTGAANYRFEPVDIVRRQSGGWMVTDLAVGEWMEYTLDVAASGRYDVTVHAASIEGGGVLRLSFNGVSGPVFVIPATGGALTTAPVTAAVDLQAGIQIMRASVVLVRPFHLDEFVFTPALSTAVEEQPDSDAILLYPNPVEATVFVRGLSGSFEIVDMLGRTVRSFPELTESVDLSGLASGQYILVGRSGTGTVQRLFVKR